MRNAANSPEFLPLLETEIEINDQRDKAYMTVRCDRGPTFGLILDRDELIDLIEKLQVARRKIGD